MLEFFDYFIIGFVLAFIVVPWHLTFAATAIVLLSAGVGSLVGSFFFGWLADRIGRMPVFTFTTAAFTIPSGLMYFTPEGNWHFLTLFRFIVGFGVGGLYSVDLPTGTGIHAHAYSWRCWWRCDRADSRRNFARQLLRRLSDPHYGLERFVPYRPVPAGIPAVLPLLDARVAALAVCSRAGMRMR